MSELSPETEREILIAISEAIDPWWKVNFSVFSDDELRMMSSLSKKEERGESLTESEQKTMFEINKKAESSILM